MAIIIIICIRTQALYTGCIIFVILEVVKVLAPFYWVAVELKKNVDYSILYISHNFKVVLLKIIF